jgi:hypothetical protein
MDQFNFTYYFLILFVLSLIQFRKVFISWFKSRSNPYSLSLGQLFGLFLRKQDLKVIVDSYNNIKMNDLNITLQQLEIFLIMGGRANDLLTEAQNAKNEYKTFNYQEYSDLYFLKNKPIQTISFSKNNRAI